VKERCSSPRFARRFAIKKTSVSLATIGVTVLCFLTGWRGGCNPSPAEKIELRVLYAGHPKSSREEDFVGFLDRHFVKIGRTDLAEFKEEQAQGYDVVILDYDGAGFNSPLPRLSRDYIRPTVTMGVTGARVCDSLNLKPGYL
jgi:hypothetical protein